MKSLLASLTLLLVATTVFADEATSKMLAMASSRSSAIVSIGYDFTNELGSRGIVGQAVCVDDSGLFLTFSIESWMKKENVKNVLLTPPGSDKKMKAEFLWNDPQTGVAVVRALEKGQFSAVRPAQSDAVKVGDMVASVGIFEGDPANASYVSAAYVTGSIRVPEQLVIVGNGKLTNIGSPVFNQAGEIIGIVGGQPFSRFEAALPNQQPMEMFMRGRQESMFYRPWSEYAALVEYAKNSPQTPRQLAWIGVISFTGLSKDSPVAADIKADAAVMIDQVVPGQVGEKAGLKNRDVIVAVNGKALEKLAVPELVTRNLENQIAKSPIGKPIELGLQRNGKQVTVKVTPEVMPERPADAPRMIVVRMGFTARGKVMLDKHLIKLPTAAVPGVIVMDVQQRSPADAAGLKQDDLITAVNGQNVETFDQFKKQLDSALADSANKTVVFVIKRGEQTQNITIQPLAATAVAK